MNDTNVYAPPQTDIRQNTGGGGNDPALRGLSTKDLKALFNHSHTIRALIFLWFLGLALILLVIAGTARMGTANAMGVPLLLLGALLAACIYGCWHRPSWGYPVGIVVCVLILMAFPIGTLCGLLGLFAFVNGKRLFGPDRLTHEQLKAEVAFRKANNIR